MGWPCAQPRHPERQHVCRSWLPAGPGCGVAYFTHPAFIHAVSLPGRQQYGRGLNDCHEVTAYALLHSVDERFPQARARVVTNL